ncbi:MAG: hypothetical protein ACRC3Y_09055 [Romboutsia sp.]|uniref:hypothetical protein n=1 Tax=Romboutsia sp. TaxID=1965302 RepID=UPI003F3D3C0A
MIEMVKFPYNSRAIARLDSDNVVHNHLYHNCPIGKVSKNNIVYDLYDNPVGRVENNGIIHSHHINNAPVGMVNNDGFILKNDSLVGRINSNDSLLAGSTYLLLIHENR